MRIPSLLALAGILLLPAWADGQDVALGVGAWGPLELLGREVPPGQKGKFSYQFSRTFEGAFLDTPAFVARGTRPGPTLCVTALIHGDEHNGFEIVRELFADTDAGSLAGTLITLPAANIHGFRTGTRYMPDRRDLNRAFPGTEGSSNTSLIASIIFSALRTNCSALVDLHTGSLERGNLPQVRVDLANPRALDLARHFGAEVVLGGAGPPGSLRREMMDAGIPAIIYEAGLPLRFQPDEIARGVKGLRNVMTRLGMLAGPVPNPTAADHTFSRSSWIRVPVGYGGVFFPERRLNETIRQGDLVARIHEPFTDERFEVTSPVDGLIIGIAIPQVVFSGYALVHVARR